MTDSRIQSHVSYAGAQPYHPAAVRGQHSPAQTFHAGPPQKSFSIGESLHSLFWGGTKKFVGGLFSLQGAGMMAGAIGLSIATGGAAIPFLIAGGAVMAAGTGAYSALKATDHLANGNVEGYYDALGDVGASGIGLGLSAVGARSYYRNGGQVTANGRTVKLTNAEEAAQSPFRALYRDVRGQLKRGEGGENIYQIGKNNTQAWGKGKWNSMKTWFRGDNKPLKLAGESPEQVTQFLDQAVQNPKKFGYDNFNKKFVEGLTKMTEAERLVQAKKLQLASEVTAAQRGLPAQALAMTPDEAAALQQSLRQGVEARKGTVLTAEEAAALEGFLKGKPTPAQLRGAEAVLKQRPIKPDAAAVEALTGKFSGEGKPFKPAEINAAIQEAGGDLAAAEAFLTRRASLNNVYHDFLRAKYGQDFKPSASHQVSPEIVRSSLTPEGFKAQLASVFDAEVATLGDPSKSSLLNGIGPKFAQVKRSVLGGEAPAQPSANRFHQALANDGVPVQQTHVNRLLAFDHQNPGHVPTHANWWQHGTNMAESLAGVDGAGPSVTLAGYTPDGQPIFFTN